MATVETEHQADTTHLYSLLGHYSLATGPTLAVKIPSHFWPEHGLKMSSDNDDTSHRRNPFQKLKRVINNLRTPRSRPTSPATLQSTISFTSGIIHHAHSIPEPDGKPSKYLLLAVSHEGQLLDIPTQTTSNIGYITCQCKPTQPPTITQGTQPSLTTHASYPAHPTSFWWSCHWHHLLQPPP